MSLATPSPARFELDADDRRYVHAVVRRFVPSAGDADDVTQDALLTAFRYRAQFRGDAHYRTWLYRIAWTAAIAHRRRARRAPEPAGDRGELAIVDPRASPEEQVAARELSRAVERAIRALPPSYAETLRLRLRGESEPAIARRLAISTALVKIRAHRARKVLRTQLAAHVPAP
jgi:RNA polymerase sigma-70 factor (ECF subfamily)